MQRTQSSKVERRAPGDPTAGALVPPLLAWFKQNARDLPWRRAQDPYAIWISEVMLQQTQVKTVIPYWRRWMRELPDVRALAGARPGIVLKLWEGLGYYSRARNLQQAARKIVEQHHGNFPRKFDEVLALPGIGRYTAGAICSIAFNQPTPALDGNVIRVLARVFGIADNSREKKTRAQLWELATSLVGEAGKYRAKPPDAEVVGQASRLPSRRPTRGRNQAGGTPVPLPGLSSLVRLHPVERNCSRLNQGLMELGALVCTPRRPKCPPCPLRKYCVAFRERRTDQLPQLGPRIGSTSRRFAAFVVERKRRFLVRRRPPGGVNGELWEFPNLEVAGRVADGQQLAADLFGSRPLAIQAFHRIRHTITRYRITLEVFRVEFANGWPNTIENARWCSPAELDKLAFPSAHRKISQSLRAK